MVSGVAKSEKAELLGSGFRGIFSQLSRIINEH